MAGFVYGNGTAFGLGSDFGFLFQPTHNTVYGVQKVLLSDKLFAVAGSYQSCFVKTLRKAPTGWCWTSRSRS